MKWSLFLLLSLIDSSNDSINELFSMTNKERKIEKSNATKCLKAIEKSQVLPFFLDAFSIEMENLFTKLCCNSFTFAFLSTAIAIWINITQENATCEKLFSSLLFCTFFVRLRNEVDFAISRLFGLLLLFYCVWKKRKWKFLHWEVVLKWCCIISKSYVSLRSGKQWNFYIFFSCFMRPFGT